MTDQPDKPRLTSVVFRLTREKRDDVAALAKRTRVIQSEYLREAIDDLLKKHAEKLDGTP